MIALPRLGSLVLLLALTVLPSQGCTTSYSAEAIEAWVVDEDTGQAVEGVHVVAHWALHFGLEGGQEADLQILETVTDSSGRFFFPAWGPLRVPPELPWDARMQNFDPELIFFKSGYRSRTAFNDRNGPPYSSAGPKLRRSLWNGKRIKLSKFQGTSEAYASMLGSILTGVSWGKCGWTKLPRMALAIDREAKRIEPLVGAMRVGSIPTIADLRNVAKGTSCENVDAILGEYR